jgi:hypothetical protein
MFQLTHTYPYATLAPGSSIGAELGHRPGFFLYVKYFSDFASVIGGQLNKERRSEKMETMGVDPGTGMGKGTYDWILSILSLIPIWSVEVIG